LNDCFFGEFTVIAGFMALMLIALGDNCYSILQAEDTAVGLMTSASDSNGAQMELLQTSIEKRKDT